MEGCHCAKVIFGFWEAQMTPQIKTKIAGKPFNSTTYHDIFKQADDAWRANGGAAPPPAVVAATVTSSSSPASSPTSTEAPQVSAVARGRGG